MWKYCLLSALIFVSIANAHVSLTYPPARKYDLDFLDDTRTQAPCGGMPQGFHKTKILRGSKLKVEWHLGYAHNGGFNIELLNGNVTIWDAASPNDWINTADGKFVSFYFEILLYAPLTKFP